MEALRDNLTEIEIGSSVESFQKFLESQKELFHSQIDQLQSIVVTQCKLTGVNPLSQEMAAGALSIKIGKRPRDLLNPKAVMYMQAVFSIKDAVSKKESRDISAQFGVTVTQVRDFFNSQRSRVRKSLRLSREKAIRANPHQEQPDRVPTNCNTMIPISPVPLNSIAPHPVGGNSFPPSPAPLTYAGLDPVAMNSACSVLVSVSPCSGGVHVPLNSGGPNLVPLSFSGLNPVMSNSCGPNSFPLTSVGVDPVPFNSVGPNPFPLSCSESNPVPLNSVCPLNDKETPSCSTQDDILPGLDGVDKRFVEDIFDLLRKEETFSGQVKLMEKILQIKNTAVLNWFLKKGGVMILATWLSEAAAEEQTSVLLVTLDVLCHLPLHKALPEHMSAILQSVNKLRFYRMSDISNRARILLSRWTKIFARSQAMKKGMRSSTDAQEMILKQSIDEIMGNELWQPNTDNPDNVLALPSEGSENIRKMESSHQPLKLLPASTDDPSKKHVLGAPSSHNRERRKVQLVEHPGQKTAGRSPQAAKAVPVNQGRPMSADDIQKAKMRALHMQNKYGKTGSPSNIRNGLKTGGLNKPSSTPSINLPQVSKVPVPRKIEEQEKAIIDPQNISNKDEASLEQPQKLNLRETLEDFCKRIQILWQTPPEVKLNHLWRVGTGENSKEVDVQKNRNRREMETIYRTVQEIPSNPKEPWDLEMDYDDTLTPEIPIEQPPDVDCAETQVSHNEHVNTATVASPPLPQIAGGSAAEPDLELLAVLLKNPELVFALTSGQAGNAVNEETIKLLDMIKMGGTGLAGFLNGVGGRVEEKVEVSLPSPTPSSNPGTSGRRSEFAKNPFSQHSSTVNRVGYTDTGVLTVTRSAEKHTGMLQPNQVTNVRIQQRQSSMQLPSQQVSSAVHPLSYPQTNTMTPEMVQRSMVHPSHQRHPINSSILHVPASEMSLTMNNLPVTTSIPNSSAAAGPSLRYETLHGIKSSPAFQKNAPERRLVSFPMVQTSTSTQLQLQPQPQPLRMAEPPLVYPSRAPTGNVGPVPDTWRARQGLGSNPFSQINQNNYDASIGGPAQPRLQRGPPWERNEHVRDGMFESWSPENSPTRSPEYMPGTNYAGLRTNTGWDYVPDNMARQPNSSGYPDHNKNGNRRWR